MSLYLRVIFPIFKQFPFCVCVLRKLPYYIQDAPLYIIFKKLLCMLYSRKPPPHYIEEEARSYTKRAPLYSRILRAYSRRFPYILKNLPYMLKSLLYMFKKPSYVCLSSRNFPICSRNFSCSSLVQEASFQAASPHSRLFCLYAEVLN